MSDHITYVGAQDDDIDLFEGQYPLTQGISYNSYIVKGDKIAVVDSVDIRRCQDWLSSLRVVLADRKPDYIIVQHMEPDHSASLEAFMDIYPDTTVVISAIGAKMLGEFFPSFRYHDRVMKVSEGSTLDLGGTVLTFYAAPMVHWPEVIVTHESRDGVLFSADAFGSFAMTSSPGATSEAWAVEARRYYTNIVGRYGVSVQKVLGKIKGLDINIIAPLHGPVLSGNLAYPLGLYDKWSRYEPEEDGVLVAYASIYGHTATAARYLASTLESLGCENVVLLDLCRHDVSYAVSEAFRLSRMALCAATVDATVFAPMAVFLDHIAHRNLRGRTVGLVENGSWAPVAARKMADKLVTMTDMKVVEPAVTLHSAMTDADTATLRTLAAALLAE
ncbi:MAG: FprA family A-type flavoprotein [Muribaculaceae bacterium]|nr:FprA family A-type flavoprotein [Muribaculaceae bacterium]